MTSSSLSLERLRREAPWLDERFWEACVKGSDKAAEIVWLASVYAAKTVNAVLVYEEATMEAFDKTLAACVPPALQFPDAAAFLDALYKGGAIRERISARSVPFAPRETYSALWKQGKRVPVSQLAHDATLYAVANWSGKILVRLVDIMGKENPEYNSQDAASAMFLMWTTLQQKQKEDAS